MGLSRRDFVRRLVGKDTLRTLGRALLQGPDSILTSRKGPRRTMEEAIWALQSKRRNRSSKPASNAPPDDSGAPRQPGNQERNQAAGPDSQMPPD